MKFKIRHKKENDTHKHYIIFEPFDFDTLSIKKQSSFIETLFHQFKSYFIGKKFNPADKHKIYISGINANIDTFKFVFNSIEELLLFGMDSIWIKNGSNKKIGSLHFEPELTLKFIPDSLSLGTYKIKHISFIIQWQ